MFKQRKCTLFSKRKRAILYLTAATQQNLWDSVTFTTVNTRESGVTPESPIHCGSRQHERLFRASTSYNTTVYKTLMRTG